jgi:hypothetical protein
MGRINNLRAEGAVLAPVDTGQDGPFVYSLDVEMAEKLSLAGFGRFLFVWRDLERDLPARMIAYHLVGAVVRRDES